MAKKSFKEGLNSLLQRTEKKPVAASKDVKKEVKKKKPKVAKKPSPAPEIVREPTATVEAKTDAKTSQPATPANTATIELGTSLNIDNVDDLKKKLVNDSKGYKSIRIKSSNIENIDISVIQLLYAFKKDMSNSKKELSFDLQLNEEMKGLLENAGMFDEVLFN